MGGGENIAKGGEIPPPSSFRPPNASQSGMWCGVVW